MEAQRPRKAFANAPATAVALLALFFALGGSALAVEERLGSAAASAQRACGQGNVRGVAHVTGGANVPGTFTGANAVFARKFNCNGRAVQVRRAGIGIYEVRFVGNGAPTAIASGGVGIQASADRVGGGVYRVTTYPAGRADPFDGGFVIVLL
jgi:hypothetical protein